MPPRPAFSVDNGDQTQVLMLKWQHLLTDPSPHSCDLLGILMETQKFTGEE